MLGETVTKALCKVKFAKLAMSVFIQDTGLDESRSVADEAGAA
jgi:hypothetical protein